MSRSALPLLSLCLSAASPLSPAAAGAASPVPIAEPDMGRAATGKLADEMLRRWRWTRKDLESMPATEQSRIQRALLGLEEDRLRQLEKLKRIVPYAWARYVTRDGRLTPEGLRLIGEPMPGAEAAAPPRLLPAPRARAVPDAAPETLSSAAREAKQSAPSELFDGAQRRQGSAENFSTPSATEPGPVTACSSSDPRPCPRQDVGEGLSRAAASLRRPPTETTRTPPPPAREEPRNVPAGTQALASQTASKQAELAVDKVAVPGPGRTPNPVAPIAKQIPIPESAWVEVGRAFPGPGPESSPASAEKTKFLADLYRGLWNSWSQEICRQIRIPIKESVPLPPPLKLTVSVYRAIRRLPNTEQLAIVDRWEMRPGIIQSPGIATLLDNMPVRLSYGVELAGRSEVIRPLKHQDTCHEMFRIPDITDIKEILPINAKRIRKMKVGETWKLPIRLRAWISPGVSQSGKGYSLSASFGYSREGEESVSLRRLGERELRLRLRFNNVQVYGPSGELAARPFGRLLDQTGVDTRDWMGNAIDQRDGAKMGFRLADRWVLGVFNRWLTARASLFARWMDGEQSLIEFSLDPENREQMAALEQLLAGGSIPALDTLLKMTRGAAAAWAGVKPSERDLMGTERKFSAALGKAASFFGLNKSDQFDLPFRFKVPFLLDFRGSVPGLARSDDHTIMLDEQGGQFNVYKAHGDMSIGFVDIPYLGNLVKHNQRESALALAYTDQDGVEYAPVAMYLAQDGFTYNNMQTLRNMLGKANAILKYAGAQGAGYNERLLLPEEHVLPGRDQIHDAELYRRGTAAFTLILNDKALQEIRHADAGQVVRAYIHSIEREPRLKQALQWIVERGSLEPDGDIRYSESAMRGDFPSWEHEDIERVRNAAGRVAELTQKLRALGRNQRKSNRGETLSGPEQAKELRDLISGRAGAHPFDYVLKVLVQLVKPEDIFAEFTIKADPRDRALPKIKGHYILNKEQGETALIRRMGETISRFAQPSELLD